MLQKPCFLTFSFLSIQCRAEIAASEREVRKRPGLGYFSHQFSPGPPWVEDISHFSWGTGTLVVSPFVWCGTGEIRELQGEGSCMRAGWSSCGAASTGVFRRNSKAWQVFSSLVPSWLVIFPTMSPLQLFSVLLYGPQLAYLLSLLLNFLNKPIGNDK